GGAANPTLSVNGTNGAKQTVATFAKAGVYHMRVRISDGSRFVESIVNVTVAQTLTAIAVMPQTLTIPRGSSTQLSASARDQFGDAMATQPVFAWSIASGDGSVNSDGLFTPGSVDGAVTVAASISGETI